MFKPGQFRINGLDSEEFDTYLVSRPQRITSGRVIEMRPRPGNDSVVIDYAHYPNVEWKIKCAARANAIEDVSHLEDRIRAWLDMSAYSDFIYHFDEHYIYQAIVIGPPIFNGTHKDGNWTPFEFIISLRPFKMSYTGLNWKKNENVLINIEKYPSKPKIHIIGSGDISFWINEKKFDLKKIENEIIIDSQLEESYKLTNSILEIQDYKTTFLDFPILPVGHCNFRWQGNVQEFNILPRWRTKV